MAGFDEFFNELKEANRNRMSSMDGLNGIIEKINEAKKIQYEAKPRAVVEEFSKNKPLSPEEQKSEDLKQRKANSNKIIMNSSSKKMENVNSNVDSTNDLNSKEIFPLSFTSENIVQGFIFSEVLGKPKYKRRRAR